MQLKHKSKRLQNCIPAAGTMPWGAFISSDSLLIRTQRNTGKHSEGGCRNRALQNIQAKIKHLRSQNVRYGVAEKQLEVSQRIPKPSQPKQNVVRNRDKAGMSGADP